MIGSSRREPCTDGQQGSSSKERQNARHKKRRTSSSGSPTFSKAFKKVLFVTERQSTWPETYFLFCFIACCTGFLELAETKFLRCRIVLFVCLRLHLGRHFSGFFRAPEVPRCSSLFSSIFVAPCTKMSLLTSCSCCHVFHSSISLTLILRSSAAMSSSCPKSHLDICFILHNPILTTFETDRVVAHTNKLLRSWKAHRASTVHSSKP